jgi:ElaB/YqjD/DUF883 family membrane-anchored ribosome-binding protein
MESDLMPDFMERPATVEDVLREVSRFKSTIADTVEDSVRSTLRAIDQGRDIADDAIRDARRAVKQNPLQSMGIVFAAGVMAGAFAAWLGSRQS